MTADGPEPPLDPTASPNTDRLPERPDGDSRTAFSTAYREHSAAVFGLARRTCGPTLAADITHETFLRLWTRPEKFDPAKGSLRTYLLTVSRHLAIDIIRAEASRRSREDRAANAPNLAPDVDHDLLQDEQTAWLHQALNELHPQQREAIVTAFYGQCTYRQAAVVLGEPEGTIKARIRAGLRQLRAAQARRSTRH